MSQAERARSPVEDVVPVAGTCYGYAIRSPLAFAYLRDGAAGDRLDVVESDVEPAPAGEPTFRWSRTPEQDFEGRLYIDDSRYDFWSDREGWFHIDPDAPSITVPASTESLARERRMLGIPTVLCFLRRGDLSVHAAAAEVDGGAVLFAAPGRFGKTTLAGGFLRAGFRVLSEDISCCRVDPEPVIFPGPAVLRVRPDAYQSLEFPGTQVIAEEPGRVHLGLRDAQRGDGSPVPIKAVVFLRAGSGDTSMNVVPATDALRDLWALSWKLPLDQDLVRCFNGVTTLASKVVVWDLHRELTFDRLDDVVETIVATCR